MELFSERAAKAGLHDLREVAYIHRFCSVHRLLFSLPAFNIFELEESLLDPVNRPQPLEDLAIKLLRAQVNPKVAFVSPLTWVGVLRELAAVRGSPFWTVGESPIPMDAAEDGRMKELTPRARAVIIAALCDWRWIHSDAITRVEEAVKSNKMHADSLRSTPIGVDAEGAVYWWLGSGDPRLYKSTAPPDDPVTIDSYPFRALGVQEPEPEPEAEPQVEEEEKKGEEEATGQKEDAMDAMDAMDTANTKVEEEQEEEKKKEEEAENPGGLRRSRRERKPVVVPEVAEPQVEKKKTKKKTKTTAVAEEDDQGGETGMSFKIVPNTPYERAVAGKWELIATTSEQWERVMNALADQAAGRPKGTARSSSARRRGSTPFVKSKSKKTPAQVAAAKLHKLLQTEIWPHVEEELVKMARKAEKLSASFAPVKRSSRLEGRTRALEEMREREKREKLEKEKAEWEEANARRVASAAEAIEREEAKRKADLEAEAKRVERQRREREERDAARQARVAARAAEAEAQAARRARRLERRELRGLGFDVPDTDDEGEDDANKTTSDPPPSAPAVAPMTAAATTGTTTKEVAEPKVDMELEPKLETEPKLEPVEEKQGAAQEQQSVEDDLAESQTLAQEVLLGMKRAASEVFDPTPHEDVAPPQDSPTKRQRVNCPQPLDRNAVYPTTGSIENDVKVFIPQRQSGYKHWARIPRYLWPHPAMNGRPGHTERTRRQAVNEWCAENDVPPPPEPRKRTKKKVPEVQGVYGSPAEVVQPSSMAAPATMTSPPVTHMAPMAPPMGVAPGMAYPYMSRPGNAPQPGYMMASPPIVAMNPAGINPMMAAMMFQQQYNHAQQQAGMSGVHGAQSNRPLMIPPQAMPQNGQIPSSMQPLSAQMHPAPPAASMNPNPQFNNNTGAMNHQTQPGSNPQ